MSWAELVSGLEELRNAHKMFVGKLEGKETTWKM